MENLVRFATIIPNDDHENSEEEIGRSAVDAILWFLGGILLIGLLISCIVKIRKIALRRNSELQQVVVSEKLYRDRDIPRD